MLLRSRRIRRGLQGATAIAVLAAFATAASLASAQTQSPDELREQRKDVQEDAAVLVGEVDAITDDIDSLTGAINALQDAVDAQQAALEAAERQVRDAESAELRAEAAIAELEAEMAETQLLLTRSAVDAFVSFQGPNSEGTAIEGDPWEQARTEALIEFGTGNTAELIDELRALGAELEAQRKAAENHTLEVELLREEVSQRVADLDRAFLREEEALNAVEDRLDARLAEVAALEQLDASLAAEIRAGEQRIADAIADRNRGNVGSVTIPNGAPVTLTTVRGITVNVLIADQLEGFLAAMAAEGYTLRGGGYRDSSAQVALRRSNCGTSEYAIWEMPASRCRPPTARPGLSQHEKGLAIDFTLNGSIIRSRSSGVFQTMIRLAPAFGFENLPSEPWHWSTTGG